MSGEPDLSRALVVGPTCAGKSTFGAELAKHLNCDHVELDTLHWLPDWVGRDTADFRALVAEAAAAKRWVTVGNYSPVRDILWPRATAVIWLNYGFPLVFGRCLRRTWRRAWTQEELFSGNRESYRKSFFSFGSIIVWLLRTYRRRRHTYRTLRESGDYPHLNWIEFRKPDQAADFLTRLKN